jgi:hypothetical protein
VTSHPAWLHASFLNASVAGGDVVIYEGQDPTSGRQILHQDAAANATNHCQFDPPVWMERGIYVDIGSNVSQVTIHYTVQSFQPSEGE